ncbi:S8 family serine peptidase [Methanogenium marinum]|uniref:S8 family serine peptidase n=1 Tax=Methanogenium marinum TaxID=348610 RepID=A0A9Q4KUK0_9EURY|nr:S8 family serine peptidase [Methanogenium marinum]MDE4908362.1 S8 family serine peptidase [Methanogenium marinum]
MNYSTIPIILCVLLFFAGVGIIPATAGVPGEVAYENSTATLNYTALDEGGNFNVSSIPFQAESVAKGSSSIKEDISEISYPDYVPGSVLVIYENDNQKTTSDSFDSAALSANAVVGATVTQEFVGGVLPGCQVVSLPDDITVDEAVSYYENQPGVAYAQPNYIYTIDAVPNDPYYSLQWGLQNTGQSTSGFPSTAGADISAEEAWDSTTGSDDIVIAVIDTGVDYLHDDLAANMWDDGSGNHGYDFVNDDNDPMDDNSHGTHCAGIIAAVGNNGVGVSGVCWDARIMALKVLNAEGTGTSTDDIEAINYAVTNGADILSCSWGGTGYDPALKEAIDNSGLLVVCAAGNDGTNNDDSPHYPSNYESPNILSVAATAPDDSLSSFSNYGATSVDVGAPGTNIYSTIPREISVGTSVYSDDFSSAAGWYEYDNTQSDREAWHLDTTTYISAASSLATGQYDNNWDQWIIKEDKISLVGLTNPVVRYQWLVDTQIYSDPAYLGISEDGSNFSFKGLSGKTGGFIEQTYDLTDFGGTDYTGKDIWIAFRLKSDASTTGRGVWVDDIQIGELNGPMTSVYGYKSGTSMATPMVSGVAGLVLAENPTYTAADLKEAIVDTADPIPALAGKCVSGGRINAYAGIAGRVNADFIVDATNATAPFLVNFTDISTGDPTDWAWDFGDDGISSDENPSHIYNTTGIYNVSLSVTNGAFSDTITKTGLVTILPPAPTAEFDLNRNLIVQTDNDTFSAGTYHSDLTYRLHAANTDLNTTLGNLVYRAAAENITWVDNPSYATWNTTNVEWDFPSEYVLFPGSGLDAQAKTSSSEANVYNHTITRINNVSLFRTDGGQRTNVSVVFNGLDFESVFVGFASANNTNVTTEIISDSVETNAPLAEPLPSGGDYHLKLDTAELFTGKEYYFTFDTGVFLNGSAVIHKPFVYIWEGMSHDGANIGETYKAEVPAALLPADASGFSVETNTSCEWNVTRQNNLLSVLNGSSVKVRTPPVADFSATPKTGDPSMTVTFTDLSTGDVDSWLWTFGDGTSSTEQSPVHTYTENGVYTVTLSVNGGESISTEDDYIRVTSLLLGDANSDGEVNQADTLRVLKEVVGMMTPPVQDTDEFEQTDVHWNSAIDIGDAMFIAQYKVGLRDKWFELV